MEFDPQGRQKDHLLNKDTPGRWKERRWNIRNDLPPLGVTAYNRIRPFVPGMIMSASHPDWPEDLFLRRFATSAPHTTGKSRTCESCHLSSIALGLGKGKLTKGDDGWHFGIRRTA